MSFDSQMCNAQNMQKAVDAAADSCCIVDCSKYICLDVVVPVSDVTMCARESSQIDYTRGNGKNGNCESSIFSSDDVEAGISGGSVLSVAGDPGVPESHCLDVGVSRNLGNCESSFFSSGDVEAGSSCVVDCSQMSLAPGGPQHPRNNRGSIVGDGSVLPIIADVCHDHVHEQIDSDYLSKRAKTSHVVGLVDDHLMHSN